MKRVLIFIALLVPTYTYAADTEAPGIQKEEKKNAFKGLLYKVWGKFRLLSPKDTRKVATKTSVVTAGIRGAETTTSTLQPYWKDDKTNDKKFVQQLQDFAHAQKLVDKGDFQQANQAFNNFTESYPGSDLEPNAKFAIGMTLGGLGQSAQCVEAFQGFIKNYPSHPLVDDARSVVAEFK
jgi:TolA-binding protein